MQWSDQKPKAPGWYWYRVGTFVPRTITHIYRDAEGRLACTFMESKAVGSVKYFDVEAEFAGPIPEPTPDSEASP